MSTHPLTRFLLGAFLCFTFSSIRAQDCVLQEVPVQGRLTHFAAFPTDGLVGIVDLPSEVGDLQVVRIDAQGEVRWRKVLATTDPLIGFTVPQLLARPDGGIVVYGIARYRYAQQYWARYFNYFIISLAPDGAVEWARYYSQRSVHEHFTPVCALLPGGDIMMANPRDPYGIDLSRIGAMGEPVWSKHFRRTLLTYDTRTTGMVVGPGDSVTLCGNMGLTPFVMHLDGSGEPIWNHFLDPSIWHPSLASGVARVSDGTTLLYGRGGSVASAPFLLRFGGDGAIQSARTYSETPAFDRIKEMTNGDLVFVGRNGVGGDVMRTNASGEVIGAWHYPSPSGYHDQLASIGNSDTLLIVLSGDAQPEVLRIADYEDPSCTYTSTTITSTEPALPPTTTAMDQEVRTLKSWLISLAEPLSAVQCDMVASIATSMARPGFETYVTATVFNMSFVPSGTGTVSLSVDPSLVYEWADPTPDQIVGNVLTWNDMEFDILATGTFYASFLVPPTTPLGTPLNSTLTVTQPDAEVTLTNNTATWTQEVTGSYDPNDKLVRPEGMYHFENDSILDYTIRFQNTGTDTAFTVVIVDTLSADLNVSTFKPGAASHPYTYTLNGGGLLTFTFADILLPDSNVNEAASHGLVKFSIKPHAPVAMGHAFVNRAYIYFDFNEPIITPDAVAVVGLPTRVVEVERAEQPHLYPVPAKQAVTVVLPRGERAVQAWLLSPDGRRSVVSADFQGERTVVSVAHLAAGVHFLQLVDRTGRVHVARFVKE